MKSLCILLWSAEKYTGDTIFYSSQPEQNKPWKETPLMVGEANPLFMAMQLSQSNFGHKHFTKHVYSVH